MAPPRARPLLVCALLAVSALPDGTATASRPGLAVTGFQLESDSPALIDASAPALATVEVDGVNLDASGAAIGSPDADARRQRARAHADRLAAVLVVGNYAEAIRDFSEPVAHRLLHVSISVERVARSVAAAFTGLRFDGVSVDLESLTARDTRGLVSFVAALRRALPARDAVSADVPNFTTAGEYRSLPGRGPASPSCSERYLRRRST
jgi:spore germination protein